MTAAALATATLLLATAPDLSDGIRCSVAPVGDVDGDGAGDFALARRGPGYTPGDAKVLVDPGVVWIFSGADGRRLRTLRAPVACGDFGRVLENVGDTNADGHQDLAISGGNRVWLFSAVDGAMLHELGAELARDGYGAALAGGGDVDGDGCDDVAVHRAGEGDERVDRVAAVFVFSGRTGSLLRVLACEVPLAHGSPANEVLTRLAGETLAQGVALVPDRDGDGGADLAVVVSTRVPDSKEYAVQMWVEIRSSDRWTRIVRFAAPTWAWILRVLGDVDADEVPDLVLSCPDRYVAVCSGSSGALLHVQDYGDGYMHSEGTNVDVLGDVNGDGRPDLLVGANETTVDCDPGGVFVHSGLGGRKLHAFGVPSRDADECGVGMDACAIGDANCDGIRDIAVHMPRLREARVLSGKDMAVITVVDLSELEPVERR